MLHCLGASRREQSADRPDPEANRKSLTSTEVLAGIVENDLVRCEAMASSDHYREGLTALDTLGGIYLKRCKRVQLRTSRTQTKNCADIMGGVPCSDG